MHKPRTILLEDYRHITAEHFDEAREDLLHVAAILRAQGSSVLEELIREHALNEAIGILAFASDLRPDDCLSPYVVQSIVAHEKKEGAAVVGGSASTLELLQSEIERMRERDEICEDVLARIRSVLELGGYMHHPL